MPKPSSNKRAKHSADPEPETKFLQTTGLETLDEYEPIQAPPPASTPATVQKPQPSEKAIQTSHLKDEDLEAKTSLTAETATSMFYGFIGSRINYTPRFRLSRYYPSALMMDYIVHSMNNNLVDNFYFKRAAPDYHPYILRLYFGILFWVQCLRAGRDVAALVEDHSNFLSDFLACHSLETLAVPGPLLVLFKSLCSSQPEIPSYGKVYPRVPRHPGPALRSSFINEGAQHHVMPNIPGIFALLEHLNGLINSDHPTYPKKGRHIPVTETAAAATIFGHHSFPVLADRSDHEKWSLVSSGLQYRCEADQKLNENFAERYEEFDFPITAAQTNLTKMSSYMCMYDSMAWFTQVKEVAATAATFFAGSGTLADCAPTGIVANQITVHLSDTEAALPAPTSTGDKRSLFPFAFRMKTTARNLPPLAETTAALAQTHIAFPTNHPVFNGFGVKTAGYGPFWDIRPIESGPHDDSSYLSIGPMVKRMMRLKGPA